MNDNRIIDIKTCKVENINEKNYEKQINVYKKLLETNNNNNHGFKKYLENHTLTYKDHQDIWSIKIRETVKVLYGYEWNKRLKPLLSIFTIYVNWNLHTFDLDEYEVSFLVYQYLRYKAHGIDVRRKYAVLKKYLLEIIDEDDLDNWLMQYREMRLEAFR